MKDPFGAVLILVRDDPAVSAIVAKRVSSLFSKPPCVVLTDLTDTPNAFGPGSGRAGLQRWYGVAKCYGTPDATGGIGARQLAGAVVDALHNHRPVTVAETYLAQIFTPEIGGQLIDPDTKHPYYPVRIEAVAGAQAVA